MFNKNSLIVIAILVVVAAAGLFFLPAQQKEATQNTDESGIPQGKLNINVVCESALSYMTFTDSASADAFVAECKEGKHPEVIDHYKAQMGLGEGTAI